MGVEMIRRRERASDVWIAMRVSAVSIAVNVALSLFKLLAGIFGHSEAMISDAVHSASDVFSTCIVMVGVNVSNKKSDREHPYGHERMECVASMILAVILAGTGIGIGIGGIEKIASSGMRTAPAPGVLALAAAIVSILVKEWMYWYARGAAKKLNSGALMADAWHHRSDALSSVGALIGIAGARMGFLALDPAASVVICVFIEKAALQVFRDAVDKMVDKSCDALTVERMYGIIARERGVKAVDDVRTRRFGSRAYVDVEIAAEADMPLRDAHQIAQNVHDAIEKNFREVKHCMVHVNPYPDQEEKKMEIQIRNAGAEDAPEILEIMKAAADELENKEWYVTDDEAYILAHMSEKGFTLKAIAGEKIMGFLIVHMPELEPEHLGDWAGLTDEQKRRSAYMDSVCVRREARGMGLMKRLLQSAQEALASQGICHVLATVHPQNQSSLRSFLAMGYREIARAKKYGGLPRVIVYKEISDGNEKNHPFSLPFGRRTDRI